MDPTAFGAHLGAFSQQLAAWAATALTKLVASPLVLFYGWWIAGWAERTVGRLLDLRIEPTLRTVIVSAVRYAILVVLLVAVLSQLGIQTTSVLAALGAIGLAIGLALQGTLANIAAGIMLLWLRPFKVGDSIEAGGIAGTLKEVGLFACHIDTSDGVFQFVPNSELWNKRLVNYSRHPTRLVDLQFGIAYDDSIVRAREVLVTLAASDARIHRDPAPEVFVAEIGENAVVLALRVWTDTAEHGPVRRALIEQGKLALESAGLTLPFPQRDVRLRRVSANTGRCAPAT
jgi:small conductance mechanosensitive channel